MSSELTKDLKRTATVHQIKREVLAAANGKNVSHERPEPRIKVLARGGQVGQAARELRGVRGRATAQSLIGVTIPSRARAKRDAPETSV
jgi:hypothetical protein